jgi:hypothetical protein
MDCDMATESSIPTMESAPPVKKRRGRKPITGSCATREELLAEVLWFYEHTTTSLEAIGKRFKISASTAAKALTEAQQKRIAAGSIDRSPDEQPVRR